MPLLFVTSVLLKNREVCRSGGEAGERTGCGQHRLVVSYAEHQRQRQVEGVSDRRPALVGIRQPVRLCPTQTHLTKVPRARL